MTNTHSDSLHIYTIGYGSRSVSDLISVLQAHDIRYVIDIRTAPYSRYKPEFSKDALEHALNEAGLCYVYMGDLLGGRPNDPGCYDEDGRVDYEKVKTKEFYRQGIDRLVKAHKQQRRVSLLCSEGKPEECHRSKLIGASLDEMGIPVAHIDENGHVKTQQHVMTILVPQPSLFDDFTTLTSRKKYAPAPTEQTDPDEDNPD